ncbi:RusA family crossover junction endodeoxyribonuclease [Rhodopila sp.]|uniref:RusA family crossover junction endodeoxyribonuclease n=1 Tax=Rhodopila sp. TaxID=2480087 RepID=UPI003D0B50E8
MSDLAADPDISLPFPIEFVIRDTPRSHQSANAKGKELWKQKVGTIAGAHARTLREFFYIDHRPLAATIFYFPPIKMEGDVDNIVKLIIDGIKTILYPDDRVLERIVVQKFEPGVEVVLTSLTPILRRRWSVPPKLILLPFTSGLMTTLAGGRCHDIRTATPGERGP